MTFGATERRGKPSVAALAPRTGPVRHLILIPGYRLNKAGKLVPDVRRLSVSERLRQARGLTETKVDRVWPSVQGFSMDSVPTRNGP